MIFLDVHNKDSSKVLPNYGWVISEGPRMGSTGAGDQDDGNPKLWLWNGWVITYPKMYICVIELASKHVSVISIAVPSLFQLQSPLLFLYGFILYYTVLQGFMLFYTVLYSFYTVLYCFYTFFIRFYHRDLPWRGHGIGIATAIPWQCHPMPWSGCQAMSNKA